MVSHPQYVGSAMSIWGLAVLFATPAHVQAGLYGVAAAWTLIYAITGVQEEFC